MPAISLCTNLMGRIIAKSRDLSPLLIYECGGPGYTFLKPSEVDELVADLVLLHARLVELGMEYRNGKVYLEDIEVRNV